MRFLKRIAGFLGFAKDESHETKDEDTEYADADAINNNNNRVETNLPRKGFSVPVQVSVKRSHLPPLLVPCTAGDGGVQGLRWYARRLRIDEDGDVADEFFDEVLPDTLTIKEDQGPLPKFQLKYSTTPAKVKNQALSFDGKIQMSVEHHGRLQWV